MLSPAASYLFDKSRRLEHTVLIRFVGPGINFEYEVRKVLDTHVKVIPGSVHQSFVGFGYVNHKVKRDIGTTVTSD